MQRFSHVFKYTVVGSVPEDARLSGACAHSAAWQPPTDVFLRHGGTRIVMELPGVVRDAISVTVEGNLLCVRGSRPKSIPDDTLSVHQMEIAYGPFERIVELPPGSEAGSIEAKHDAGYLTIDIPRKGPQ